MALVKTKTNDVSLNRICCVIAGQSGCGKTFLASTLPAKDTLIISAENGLLSLRKTGMVFDSWQVKSFDDFIEAIQAIDKGIPYKNIYIDSITEILDLRADELKDKFQKKDAFVMWDQYTRESIEVLKYLRDNPKHNIFLTCLTKQEKDGIVLVDAFDFAGQKLKDKFKSFFDLTLHLKEMKFENKTERVLVTSSLTSSLAKDRSGLLDELEEPNLSKILTKILGGF